MGPDLSPTWRAVLRAVAPAAVLLGAQAVLFPAPVGVYAGGLVLGLLGALVAVGMALIYRANRIINFAQGALGVVPTVLAVELIVYSGVGYVAAGLVGAVAAVGLGAAVQRLIIRRFAEASRLVLTAATIGIAQLLVGVSIFLPTLWGHPTRAEEIASGLDWRWHLDPIVLRGEHAIAAALAVALLGLVSVALLRTSIGAGVRAAAERSDLAGLLGIPVQRLQLVVWATAALLSFAGVFGRVSIVGLPQAATDSTVALLAALAALTLGRFTHLGRIAVTAVALGVVEQAVAWNNPQHPQLFAVVLAVAILVGLLFLRGAHTRAERDATSSWQVLDEPRRMVAALRRQPAVRVATVVGVVAALACAAALPAVIGPGDLLKASTVLVLAMVGTSLVVLTGWAGQVSLGQSGFVAVGAAVGAWLTASQGVDLSAALVLTATLGGIVAVVVGLPALRLRGLFLAVTTLAFSVAVSTYLLNPDYMRWIPADRVPRPRLFGWDLTSQASMYWVCLAAFVACDQVVRRLRRGRPGRAMVAQRDGELVAAAYGIGTTRIRLIAFATSGGVAALAGCLLAHVLQSYPEQLLTPDQGIASFTSTVVGGIATPAGGLAGAVVLQASGWFLSGFWRVLPTAVGVLIVLYAFPTGIVGGLLAGRDRVLRRLYPDLVRHDAAVPIDDAEAATPTSASAPRRAPDHDRSDDAGVDRRDGALLEVRDLDVRYGSTRIIDGVSFAVPRGSTLALLGTNGAGKSTVLKAISGLVPPADGTIRFDGRDVAGLPAHRVAASGIALAPGGRGVFGALSVAENLELARWLDRRGPASAARLDDVLAMFPVLDTRRREAAASLSGGEQQMLAVGMAYIAGPKLLLIDELSLGLSPLVVERLVAFVEHIRSTGTTVVVVEQSVNLALTITDEAIFLERGQVRFRGPTAQLLERPDLFRSVFLADAATGGVDRAATPTAGSPAARDDRPAIETHGITVAYGGVVAVNDVDVEVVRGEVVGLIGPNGAGKSTLLDALSGLAPVRSGRVLIGGADTTHAGVRRLAHRGVARSFQDPRLFPTLTVSETLAIACDRAVAVPGAVEAVVRTPAQRSSERAVRATVDELLEQFGLERYRDHAVAELSTGLRRVVDLAGVAAGRPSIVLLDEPSSGLAQPEVEAMGSLLRRLRTELDLTIVLVEHDMPLAASLCDRLVAMDQGRVVAVGAPDEVLAHPHVIESYLGGSPAAINRSGSTADRSRPAGSPAG